MTRLRDQYATTIVPALQKTLSRQNALSLPRLVKAVVNVGMGRVIKDPAAQQTVVSTLTRITGQKPVLTKAKKSVASFKVRQGMVIGAMVTLRGRMLDEFVDKLINITLPRVRDFRGLDPKSVSAGTLTIGFKEHNVFPEIPSDEVERLHGLEVTLVSTARNREEALALFRAHGVPFNEHRAAEQEFTAKKKPNARKTDSSKH